MHNRRLQRLVVVDEGHGHDRIIGAQGCGQLPPGAARAINQHAVLRFAPPINREQHLQHHHPQPDGHQEIDDGKVDEGRQRRAEICQIIQCRGGRAHDQGVNGGLANRLAFIGFQLDPVDPHRHAQQACHQHQ